MDHEHDDGICDGCGEPIDGNHAMSALVAAVTPEGMVRISFGPVPVDVVAGIGAMLQDEDFLDHLRKAGEQALRYSKAEEN